MQGNSIGPVRTPRDEEGEVMSPLSGTRAQAIQRLQVGLLGLGAMILLVGLANVIMNRAQQSEAEAVAEPLPADMAAKAEDTASDPLADAGVVPEVPAQPAAAPVTVVPEMEPELYDVPPAAP
ncbi:hypothetical protein [Altericroceibacterium xinjiangense]|uniref:hypothetical protein n=1 Tax=Altericroceibacterium xinjiangense TaxID=762261 RepID=UPI000F7E3402|nr:hypothetical protein [Altericroceibacterium xinjiangense]